MASECGVVSGGGWVWPVSVEFTVQKMWYTVAYISRIPSIYQG